MKTKFFVKLCKLLICILFITTNLYSFNFLINIFYSILPQPVRSAFKGEGLQIDQFEYGFGNCNFTSLGYLNSDLQYTSGKVINENISFAVSTFYLYGGYIAHVSTPMLTTIYPGWQLETEVGYGGISYDPELKEQNRQFFVTGTSGFNWRIYKSNFSSAKSFTINLLTGYKLHYLLKDLLYYGAQVGAVIRQKISLSCEYYTTYKGGNFFVFSRESVITTSNEIHLSLSTNFLISQKYLLKISYLYKQWSLIQDTTPTTEQNVNLYGIMVSFISR
jgi:hypothetical protein